MEKRDELWPRGPCFYYDTALFPPGTDSFCLAYFARPSRGDTVCDLGSGIGLLGTLLLARQESLFIENVELSTPAAALARKTFAENGWADRAAFHEGDLRDVSVLPKAGSVDYVIFSFFEKYYINIKYNLIMITMYGMIMLYAE